MRENDPTQLGGNEKEPAHYEDNQTEKLCKHRIHQQANLSSPSITIKGSPELRDPNFRVTTSPCEDASNTRVPAHLGWWGKYDDSLIKDTPSKTEVCRNVILPDTQPPCHPSSKGWETTERTAPIFDTQEVQIDRVVLGHRLESFPVSTPFQTNFHSSMKRVHFTSSKHQT